MYSGPLEMTLSLQCVDLLRSTDALATLTPVRLVNTLGRCKQVIDID